jgi:quercetin dioxygenase-like cupin family protein
MQTWNLTEINAPDGTRDPVVLETADGARAVMLVIAPGQELGDHQVRERAWVTVVEGEAQIEANGQSLTCGTGTLVTFEPGERHAVRSAGGARILLLLAPWPGEGHFRPGEEPPADASR